MEKVLAPPPLFFFCKNRRTQKMLVFGLLAEEMRKSALSCVHTA